jgi:hypothetical protein
VRQRRLSEADLNPVAYRTHELDYLSSTSSMSAANKFVVGDMYYQCSFVPKVSGTGSCPGVSTFIYMGIVELTCSSASCDVPNHFYNFKLTTGGGEALPCGGVNIPSLEHANMSMLTWPEFLETLDDYREHHPEIFGSSAKSSSPADSGCE